jgi:hypothetical protein
MKVNKNNKLLLVLLLLVSGFTFAQQTISGLVTDEAGVPLPGATVVVNQTNNVKKVIVKERNTISLYLKLI